MKNYYLFMLLVCVVGFLACNKQTIQPPANDLGWDFQPVNKGHYIIYDVDSIIFDDFKKSIDTFRTELKDEIGETFLDDQGRTSYYVQRSVRKNATDPWVINHSFYITKDSFKLEWNENNLRFIKMVYPVKLNKKWKGNQYIATQSAPTFRWLDGWDYQYTDVLVNFNTGSASYPKCHIINQADFLEGDADKPDAFSAKTYSQEVFSQNVGLVYREVTRWEYQPSSANPFRNGFTTIFRAKENN